MTFREKEECPRKVERAWAYVLHKPESLMADRTGILSSGSGSR